MRFRQVIVIVHRIVYIFFIGEKLTENVFKLAMLRLYYDEK